MRHNDVSDDLADGFEPGPPPPMAPDGGPLLQAMREAAKPPPRMCEAGPCRNYHTFDVQMDVEQPKPERLADGTTKIHDPVFHVQTHHYCYPTPGVETKLGSLPVVRCNRWDPITEGDIEQRSRRAQLFLESGAGKEYAGELAAWKSSQQPTTTTIVVTIVFPSSDDAVDLDDVAPSATLSSLLGRAIERTERLSDPSAYEVVDSDGPIENLNMTVGQLGIQSGAVLTLKLREE